MNVVLNFRLMEMSAYGFLEILWSQIGNLCGRKTKLNLYYMDG